MIIRILAIALLFFLSCKKEKKDIESYINFNLNGTSYSLKSDPYILTVKSTQTFEFSVASNNNSNESTSAWMQIYNYDYTTGLKVLTAPSKISIATLRNTGTNTQTSTMYFAFDKDIALNIREVNNNYIKGTIDGELKATSLTTPTSTITLTNFEFVAAIQ